VVDQVVVEDHLDAAREVARPAEVHHLPALELVAHELLPVCKEIIQVGQYFNNSQIDYSRGK